jgi:signal transduction histidine kinase
LLGATLEAVRNAGRHARGGDLRRQLRLRIALAAEDGWVSVAVSDDGVGLQSEEMGNGASPLIEQTVSTSITASTASIPAAPADGLATPGARSGLLTHGALIALIGGTLSVQSQSELGATVTIRVPRAPTAAL